MFQKKILTIKFTTLLFFMTIISCTNNDEFSMNGYWKAANGEIYIFEENSSYTKILNSDSPIIISGKWSTEENLNIKAKDTFPLTTYLEVIKSNSYAARKLNNKKRYLVYLINPSKISFISDNNLVLERVFKQ